MNPETTKEPELFENEPDMGHEFDGIRELDNKLPNWWLATFYLAIIFSFGYWTYYHILEAGPLPMEKYEMEMARAEEAAAARAAQRPELTEEALLALSQDDGATAGGQVVYTQFCAACHAGQGEGSIGPNLTDDYWIHGGSPLEIMKVVEDGVPAAGMPAWKAVLGDEKVQQVTAYLLTLKGKNIPGKDPQGELEEG